MCIRDSPSVGTAHALLDAGLVAPRGGFLVQDGIAGKLPLKVSGKGSERTIAVRTPRARVQEIATPDDPRLRDALAGLKLGALPPVLMDGGRRWWLAELASEADLRNATPNWDAIVALANATESMGLFVYARSNDPVYHFAVRAFVGAPAQFEDAASGAANATPVSYTHLDVYKRQGFARPADAPGRAGGEPIRSHTFAFLGQQCLL